MSSDDAHFRAWAREVGVRLVPAMRSSSAVVNVVPEDPGADDIQFALEIGLAVLMDKPIIAVVLPGRRVPSKLLAITDQLVEGDIASPDFQERLQTAIRAIGDR